MNICAREDCGVTFDRKTHNQKYCSNNCTRLATNARIMKDYYNDRDRLRGATRMCFECGKTKLSRYNKKLICSSCELKKEVDTNHSVLEMLLNVSWQS